MRLAIGLLLLLPLILMACAPQPSVDPYFTPSSDPASGLPMYPAKVVIANLAPGAVVDTLVRDEISTEYPSYSLAKGAPVGINIHNPTADEKTMLITFEPTDNSTIDKETGISYAPTPAQAGRWVIISRSQVTIPPYSVGHIPVKLAIPKRVKGLPERWEFRLVAAPSGDDMVTTATAQRWLITMRE